MGGGSTPCSQGRRDQSQRRQDAFRTAETRFGRINVVYNNAGAFVVGELESTSEEEWRKMFDVNFWGAIGVAREAVRFFRDVNKLQGGRLCRLLLWVG